MTSLKLAFVVAISVSLAGCITPQELYKHHFAEAACSQATSTKGGGLVGCIAGLSGPKA
jgi:hypothetical protein